MPEDIPSNLSSDKEERWCLIIHNPPREFPTTNKEIEKLLGSLEEKDLICDYVAFEQARLENVLDYLASPKYEIIHYFGHIDWDRKRNESFFKLYGGDILSATVIQNSVKGPKLVFLNGCCSANRASFLSNKSKNKKPQRDIKSLADAFLMTGAKVVIGTVVEVEEDGARMLAKRFYELFLEGKSVGEDLKEARIAVMSS